MYLEKEMAAQSSILAWKIPWITEPGKLPSMGSQSRTRLSDFTSLTSTVLLLLWWKGWECVKKKLDNCMVQVYSWADECGLHSSSWAHVVPNRSAPKYICLILVGMLPTLGLLIYFEASRIKAFAKCGESPNMQTILLSYSSARWIRAIMDTGVCPKNLMVQITSIAISRLTRRDVPRVKWRREKDLF